MSYPQWITPPTLGNFSQNYSFDLNPITIDFSALLGSSIILLNGTLPTGLFWEYGSSTLTITGVALPSQTIINGQFTFRIIQPNSFVADRTFIINLVPIAEGPSWAEQPTFLGYQDNVHVATYQVAAIPPTLNQHITYSLVDYPSGMSIGSQTGVISYIANAIIHNQNITFNVNAAITSASSVVNLNIGVLANPTGPQWVTSPGSLGIFNGNDFVEINLLAEDVTGTQVTYTLISSTSGIPVQLTSDGLVFGRVPFVDSFTTFLFTVQASSVNGFILRTFSIEIQVTVNPDLFWITGSNLGSINEGEIVTVPISAISISNSVILYSVSGGMLPPNLMIDNGTGSLTGYCEYHALSKTYYFDLTAQITSQSITQQFQITVNKVYEDIFLGAYYPLTGKLKNKMIADNSNIRIREPGNITFDIMTNLPIGDQFTMSIINGIEVRYQTADEIVSSIHNWLYRPDLQLGNVANSQADSSNVSVIYRNIVDNQQGTNATVFSSSVYNTNVQTAGLTYPTSIQNVRDALTDIGGFITSGGGNGAVLSPNIDWSTGALQSINIIQPGLDYNSPPQLQITGSGNGAIATASLGLVSFDILDIGANWQAGQEYSLDVYIFNVAATFQVLSVGSNGSLSTYEIVTPGNYTQVSNFNELVIHSGNAYATIQPHWGITFANVVAGGSNYQCGINISVVGSEILPWWQTTYSPVIVQGYMSIDTANIAATQFNYESNTMWGDIWTPGFIVLQWQGIRWLGSATFDDRETTFDCKLTSIQDIETPRETLFDENDTIFDLGVETFDVFDPYQFNLSYIWGDTAFDQLRTIYDFYSTIFDGLSPSTHSETRVRKIIALNNEVFSGNNFVV